MSDEREIFISSRWFKEVKTCTIILKTTATFCDFYTYRHFWSQYQGASRGFSATCSFLFCISTCVNGIQ